MEIDIGLTQENLNGVIKILDRLLADEFVLYTKTRNYHWNVKGMHFQELHKLFQAQYEALDDSIDEIAERVRALGGNASGNLKTYLENTRLQEEDSFEHKDSYMLQTLLFDHETIIKHLRKEITECNDEHHDVGTGDFLTGLLEGHEKTAWMLRAYLG